MRCGCVVSAPLWLCGIRAKVVVALSHLKSTKRSGQTSPAQGVRVSRTLKMKTHEDHACSKMGPSVRPKPTPEYPNAPRLDSLGIYIQRSICEMHKLNKQHRQLQNDSQPPEGTKQGRKYDAT